MQLDWSFARPVDVGGMIRSGIEEGVTGGAVNALMRDPNNQNAMGMLSRFNPQAALTMQDRQSQQALRAEQTTQRANQNRRDNIIMGASFLEGVQDEAGWQRAITQARAAGVQLDGVPPNFDPAFVDQVRSTAQALIRSTQRTQPRPVGPTSLMREAEAAGVDLGTPQGQAWFRNLIQMRYAYPRPMGTDPSTGLPMFGYPEMPSLEGGPAADVPETLTDEDFLEEGGSGSGAPSNFPGGIW